MAKEQLSFGLFSKYSFVHMGIMISSWGGPESNEKSPVLDTGCIAQF